MHNAGVVIFLNILPQFSIDNIQLDLDDILNQTNEKEIICQMSYLSVS